MSLALQITTTAAFSFLYLYAASSGTRQRFAAPCSPALPASPIKEGRNTCCHHLATISLYAPSTTTPQLRLHSSLCLSAPTASINSVDIS